MLLSRITRFYYRPFVITLPQCIYIRISCNSFTSKHIKRKKQITNNNTGSNNHNNDNNGAVNKMAQDLNITGVDHAIRRKQQRGDPDTIRRISIPCDVDVTIKQSLDNATCSREILQIIQRDWQLITHPSMYGKALTKCRKWRGWTEAQQIMKIAVQSNVKLNVIVFNIFFDIMAHFDSPELCMQYLDIMVNEYKVSPDIVTFTSLIKSCRRQAKNHYGLAERFWQSMVEYNVTPDHLLYTEMISVCSKANQMRRATGIFNQFLTGYKNQISQAQFPVFSAYLNTYSRVGDVHGVEAVLKMMEGYQFELNHIVITDIIRCYQVARQYTNALRKYVEFIDNGGIPNLPMMHLKCVSLCSIIRDDIDNTYSFQEKHELYLQIQDSIYNESELYKIEITQWLISTQLSAAICLYRYVEPSTAVDIFRTLVDKKYIGYKQYYAVTGRIMIDLHSFDAITAQFILRYVIAYELNGVCSTNGTLSFIVGIGKHSNSKGALKTFVIQDLLNYNPPIKCQHHPHNAGLLLVKKNQLLPYLTDDTEMNYARNRLTYPSNDWFWADARNQASLS